MAICKRIAQQKNLKEGINNYSDYKTSKSHASDLHLGKKLQKEHLSASENFFSNLCASILKPCCDENVNPYASTKQLKKQGIYIKKRAYERSNRHISNLYLSNQQFLVNLTFF